MIVHRIRVQKLLHKQLASPQIKPDMKINRNINSLPDELIYQILSCLPYSSLAQTRFLSKRFHALSNTILWSCGSINDLEGEIISFLEGINASDPFTHPWRLLYDYGDGGPLRATIAANCQLHLNFMRPEKRTSMFHMSLEASKSDDPEPDPLSFYVKRVKLTLVSSQIASKVISSTFSRFHFLQRLHIERCRMSTLRISAPALRELTVMDCFLLKTVHVNALKLESFRFRGSRPWFLAKGLEGTKLVDAMLDFRRGKQSRYLGSSLGRLIALMKDVECLTLCRATFEEFITSEQYAGCEKFKLEKLKDLWWIDNSLDKQKTDVLLSFLRICPSLENLFITIDPKSSSVRDKVKEFDHPVKSGRLSCLKLVKIEGCIDQEAEMLLAEAIAEASTTKPLIVPSTMYGDYRESMKAEMEEKLQMKHAHMMLVQTTY